VRPTRNRHTGRVPVLLLDDDEVRAHLDPGMAVRAVREALLAGAAAGRTGPEQITVFCSVGLAGTEVALAAALLGVKDGRT
jgi:ornithine cyclodeaminase/alanine dehydrogenase-like protein (mu-crystallin family)